MKNMRKTIRLWARVVYLSERRDKRRGTPSLPLSPSCLRVLWQIERARKKPLIYSIRSLFSWIVVQRPSHHSII